VKGKVTAVVGGLLWVRKIETLCGNQERPGSALRQHRHKHEPCKEKRATKSFKKERTFMDPIEKRRLGEFASIRRAGEDGLEWYERKPIKGFRQRILPRGDEKDANGKGI